MKYTFLGRTGLKVSRICLGTMNFGSQTEEKESHQIINRALELGINFIDTADRYGNPQGSGLTEEIIGRWLKLNSGRRDDIVLATKVYGPMGPGANDMNLSAKHIRHGCEASLKRLQTDFIDLYQMHHIDRGFPHFKSKLEFLDGDIKNLFVPSHITPGAPWEEVWQMMELLTRKGKVTYVGSSNFAAWNIAQANEKAAARSFLGLVSEQSIYNLTNRMVELEIVPVCRAYGLGLIPWSPLGGGLLAGNIGSADVGRRAGLKPSDEILAQLKRYENLCMELGESPANVALAWLLSNPVVTATIIGPRTIEQLEDAAKAADIVLPADFLIKLDEIFPGPGGQAPEAYAW
ncbi:MAG: aldo/keto reductase [Spirochaetales bacterium]|jgi:aryl-alcohol dehydrogenase-like predicted oxidoreductase|nr:aldo/keto reductase [Spirochaetales bacterium]